MKVLEIRDKRAYLTNPDTNQTCPIKDIKEEDVLAIVTALLDGMAIETDEVPSQEDCPNDAERVIYEELKKQLDKLVLEKDDILEAVNAKFIDAEALYDKKEPAADFDAWGTA